MPPGNFFNATIEAEDNDEETGDVADFESILDLCSASTQQLRLRWHYRSRYEQLITFSDRNMKSSASCSEKRTAQLPGICLEAALFAGLKSVTRRLPCAFSLIVDGAGQSKGTCQ